MYHFIIIPIKISTCPISNKTLPNDLTDDKLQLITDNATLMPRAGLNMIPAPAEPLGVSLGSMATEKYLLQQLCRLWCIHIAQRQTWIHLDCESIFCCVTTNIFHLSCAWFCFGSVHTSTTRTILQLSLSQLRPVHPPPTIARPNKLSPSSNCGNWTEFD
jgi:hypothetical protein